MEQRFIQLDLKYLKTDIISGFIVFLIALPLSLGIAIASGFPPITGIYTAIIGGLIGCLSNSQLSIKGPAAGLIVIAFSCIQELGEGDLELGYQRTLGIIVVSGIIQMVFGIFRLGKISKYFPVIVIHGMMASIGIIIILKQINPLFGLEGKSDSILGILVDLPKNLQTWKPEILFIGLISIILLFGLPRLNFKILKMFPIPLLVVLVGILFTFFFKITIDHNGSLSAIGTYSIGPRFLVNLPDSILGGIQHPLFDSIFSSSGIKYIALFSIIGSLESLLTIKAIDELDPLERTTNPDRDTFVIGLGNSLSGLIGGLPMISEVVRSSANVTNGGRTFLANFFHGVFLLLFVGLFPYLIHLIPLASLGAILIYTGSRLSSISVFKEAYNDGWKIFIPFLVTIIITLGEDLLWGVLMGTVVYYLLNRGFTSTDNTH